MTSGQHMVYSNSGVGGRIPCEGWNTRGYSGLRRRVTMLCILKGLKGAEISLLNGPTVEMRDRSAHRALVTLCYLAAVLAVGRHHSIKTSFAILKYPTLGKGSNFCTTTNSRTSVDVMAGVFPFRASLVGFSSTIMNC